MRILLLALLFTLPLMAQSSTYRYLIWPPMIAGADSTASFGTGLDGITTELSQMFANFGEPCRIKKVAVSFKAITTAQSIDIRIEDPDAAGQTDGVADATGAIASPVVGLNFATMGTSVLKAAGDRYFVVLNWTATTGDVDLETVNLSPGGTLRQYQYAIEGTTKQTGAAFTVAVGCDEDNDGDVIVAEGDRWLNSPNSSIFYPKFANFAYDSNDAIPTAGRQIAIGGQDVVAVGMCGMFNIGTASPTFAINVSTLAGVSLCAAGDSCTTEAQLDEDWRQNPNVPYPGCLPFKEKITLSASTTYVLSIRATAITANNNRIYYGDYGAGNSDLVTAVGGGEGAVRANTGAAWTVGSNVCWNGLDCDEVSPILSLVLMEIQDAGGGGGTVSFGGIE